jgi:predicted alpha/beta hydrolase
MPLPWIASLSLGLLALYVLKRAILDKKVPGLLPPGPRPKPVLGNLADLPPKGERDWMHWVKHKELYGKYTTH